MEQFFLKKKNNQRKRKSWLNPVPKSVLNLQWCFRVCNSCCTLLFYFMVLHFTYLDCSSWVDVVEKGESCWKGWKLYLAEIIKPWLQSCVLISKDHCTPFDVSSSMFSFDTFVSFNSTTLMWTVFWKLPIFDRYFWILWPYF